jgi:NAD(P)H-dependent FMN reductase
VADGPARRAGRRRRRADRPAFPEFNRKPVAFVGYGNVGGARAIEQLRGVVIELEMAPLRHAVHILPEVVRPVRAAEEPLDIELFASLDPRLELLVSDLVWWADALRIARAATIT